MSEKESKGDSAVLVNEKGRNKRKFLSEQLTLDLSTEVSNLSLTEFPRYDNLVEKFRNAVDEWRAMVQRSEDAIDEEGSEDSEWDDPVATELEELLSHNIFTTFITALKKIVECGYTEQVAEWAILNSSFLHGSKDAVSNVVDPALAFLRKQKEFNTPKHSIFEGLENLVDYTLLEMIFVLREVRLDFTVADAMWGLLICDLNLLNACSMDKGPTVGSSSQEASRETRSLPLSISETAIATPSESKNSGDAQELLAPKAPISSMGNQQSTCKRGGGESGATQKESSPTLLEAKGSSSSVDEKSGGSKKGSPSNSKRDLLRQKTFQFDKSYRGRLSKGAFKAKVAAWGSMVLDKSLKSQSGSSSASMKGTSSKITPPPVEGTVAAPDKIGKDPISALLERISKSHKSFVLGTDSSSKSEISVPDTPKAVNYFASIPFDETLQKHVPRDETDEAILMLAAYKKTLEKELQVWVDWGNAKVMQAARRLGKDQGELKMLKLEKEEMEKYKREKQTLEENTMKRLSEMEYALSNATGQIEVAKCTVHRLEEENDVLKDEMEAAKMKALRSAAKLEEALGKEQEYQKRLQAWEGEKGLMLEQLTNLKRQAAVLTNRIEKAKARKEQFEVTEISVFYELFQSITMISCAYS